MCFGVCGGRDVGLFWCVCVGGGGGGGGGGVGGGGGGDEEFEEH